MNKIISILALATLAACGGGGDDPGYNYAQHNGTYTCAMVNTNYVFQVGASFTENAATLQMLGKSYVFDDLFSWWKDRPRYSERVVGTADYDTVAFVEDGMVIYQGPGNNLETYYTDKVMVCVRATRTAEESSNG